MDNFIVNWILDECICDSPEKFQELQKHIKETGDELGKSYADFNRLECCLASLPTARNNGFYDSKVYRVSNYVNYIPEWYLNSDCLFVPFGVLKRDIFKNQIFDKFNYAKKLFIKSDSGFKLLTGFSIDKDDWDKEIGFLKLFNDDMILVSSHKEVEKEYRFWIVDNEIVTWSSYSWDESEYENTIEDYIYATAKTIASQIDLRTFTLDLCLTKDDWAPKVVEINNIYTSGLYNCDFKLLISKLREFTVNEALDKI